MESIERNPLYYAKLESSMMMFHLLVEYIVCTITWLRFLEVTFSINHVYMNDPTFHPWINTVQGYVFTLASGCCNIVVIAKEVNWMSDHSESINGLLTTTRIQNGIQLIKEWKSSRRRFFGHAISYLLFSYTMVISTTLYVAFPDSGECKATLIFLFTKAMVLILIPLLQFWMRLKICGPFYPELSESREVSGPMLELVTEEISVEGLEYDHNCIICLEKYDEESRLRKLKCGHAFHKVCIDTWFITSSLCPLCKMDVNQPIYEL